MKSKALNNTIAAIKAVIGGMKGGDDIIMGNTDPFDGGIEIRKEVQDNRVAHHLIKGEITEQVEELRWRNYAVSREAKYHKTVIPGITQKLERPNHDDGVYLFHQSNKKLDESVIDGLKSVMDNKWSKDKYTINVSYKSSTPRFRIEPHIKSLKFKSSPKEGYIEFLIDTLPSSNIPTSGPFLIELEKLYNNQVEYFIERCDISSDISAISFVTDGANGEDDLISYIMTGISFKSLTKDDENYTLTYTFDYVDRKDLTENFHGGALEEKYKNKENRMQDTPAIEEILGGDKTIHCAVCGKEIPPVDAQITKDECGKELCSECFGKYLVENYKENVIESDKW